MINEMLKKSSLHADKFIVVVSLRGTVRTALLCRLHCILGLTSQSSDSF